VARLRYLLTNTALDIIWRFRPRSPDTSWGLLARTDNLSGNTTLGDSTAGGAHILKSLVQRFPYWMQGRARLALQSLHNQDIATAYAEAQALRVLSKEGTHQHGVSLAILGRCYLKRGDAETALSFLSQARDLAPGDFQILEDQAAAHSLLGDKVHARELLRSIPPSRISAEGKAALQWLSQGNEGPTEPT